MLSSTVNAWRLLIPALAGLLTSCGGSAMGAVDFSGVTQPFAVPPEEIREVIEMPTGYEAMGELSVDCRDSNNSGVLVVFDTIGDCRLETLVDALRKEASRVGGEILVHRSCDTDFDTSGSYNGRLATSEHMSCRAVVARRTASGNAGSTHGIPNSQVPAA